MATLRNLAINKLREHGHTSIAAGVREMSYEPFTRPLDPLGVTSRNKDFGTVQGLSCGSREGFIGNREREPLLRHRPYVTPPERQVNHHERTRFGIISTSWYCRRPWRKRTAALPDGVTVEYGLSPPVPMSTFRKGLAEREDSWIGMLELVARARFYVCETFRPSAGIVRSSRRTLAVPATTPAMSCRQSRDSVKSSSFKECTEIDSTA